MNIHDDPRKSTPVTRPGNVPRWGRLLAMAAVALAVGVLVMAGLSGWLVSPGNEGRTSDTATADTGARPEQQRGIGNPYAVGGTNQTVGTGGEESEGRTDKGGPPAVVPPPFVQNLILDGEAEALIGREVTFRAPLHRHVNDVAFWTGDGENRILAVISRDQRDAAMRQRGAAPGNTIQADGDAMVTGTVQRLPHAEAMYSWGLTNADVAALSRRPLYVRIDRAQPAINAQPPTPNSQAPTPDSQAQTSTGQPPK